MFQTIVIGLCLVVGAAIAYVLFKSYWTQTKEKETFQAFVPAHAESPKATLSPEPPQVVAPSGPNPPNAAPPAQKKVTFAPPEQPRDPYDDVQGEQPMRDSLRHPERSFGPGVDNTETRIAGLSGTASNEAAANASFSPEFAQNGGEFMSGIVANDVYGEAVFANA